MNELMRQILIDNYSVYEENGIWFQTTESGKVELNSDDLKIFTDFVEKNIADFGYSLADIGVSQNVSTLSNFESLTPKEQKKLLKKQKKEEKLRIKLEKKEAKLKAKEEKLKAKQNAEEQNFIEEIYNEDIENLVEDSHYQTENASVSEVESSTEKLHESTIDQENISNEYSKNLEGNNEQENYYSTHNLKDDSQTALYYSSKSKSRQSLDFGKKVSLNELSSSNDEIAKEIASNIYSTQDSIAALKKLLSETKDI